MALLRGKLFAGALFAGALFGVVQDNLGSGQHRAREEEKWRNLPEYYQYKPKEKQEVVHIEQHFLPPTENVSPEELVAILKTVVSKIQSPAPIAVYDQEEDDEEAILFLMGVLK